MNFINYRYNSQSKVETVEDLRGLSKAEKQRLIDEYRSVSANYYPSSRACKSFYND